MLACIAALALVPALAGACAGAPGDGGESSEAADTSSPSAAMKPSELVGLWLVEADGEESGARLQVGSRWAARDLTLWRDCGPLYGMWEASGGSLLLALDGFGEGCEMELPDWLREVSGYAQVSSGVVLLDSDEHVVATLTPDTSELNQYDADHGRGPERPELGADEVAALDESVGPPAGIEPASVEDLLGRWAPAADAADDAHLVIDASGGWSGSDGCNSTGGRWLRGDDGRLLVTSGAITLMACEGMHLIDFPSARWAQIDGDRLVLYSATGEIVDQAVRTR